MVWMQSGKHYLFEDGGRPLSIRVAGNAGTEGRQVKNGNLP
jgi:hypothetical protein